MLHDSVEATLFVSKYWWSRLTRDPLVLIDNNVSRLIVSVCRWSKI